MVLSLITHYSLLLRNELIRMDSMHYFSEVVQNAYKYSHVIYIKKILKSANSCKYIQRNSKGTELISFIKLCDICK